MNEPATIITADDHQMFLDGLRLLLKSDSSLKVVAEAKTAAGLLKLIADKSPDLVITDLSMGDMKGTELIMTMKSRFPDTRVLVITMHHEQEIINEVLYAEAEGYLLKNAGKSELLAAVHSILGGSTHYDPAVLRQLVTKVQRDHKVTQLRKDLTSREQEILSLIVQEMTSREIADRLFISKLTVDKHRLHIMEKTGTKTLVGLIKYAIVSGLADQGSTYK
jgi:DNA-binding NarL/FixJ family response regulator